jgi:hypothetical protein
MRVMSKVDTARVTLDDADGRRLHAVWSRSGKRLGVSVLAGHGYHQMELRPDQVQKLVDFLVETNPASGSSSE